MASKKKKHKIFKYLIEGLLIVLSVLLALGVNSFAERQKIKKKKRIAIASLKKEILQNEAIMKDWVERHNPMSQRLNSVAYGKNDSLKTELKKYDYFNISVLFKDPNLINDLVTKTAWETCKSTDIINEFDFETIQRLTNAYNMQDIIMDKTVNRIIDNFFKRESMDIENLDGTLMQMSMFFLELTGQERVMLGFYEDARKALNEID